MVTETKLPTDGRAIRMDPSLSQALEEILEPLSGKDLEKAQQAIIQCRKRQIIGTFPRLLGQYREAIEAALAK